MIVNVYWERCVINVRRFFGWHDIERPSEYTRGYVKAYREIERMAEQRPGDFYDEILDPLSSNEMQDLVDVMNERNAEKEQT